MCHFPKSILLAICSNIWAAFVRKREKCLSKRWVSNLFWGAMSTPTKATKHLCWRLRFPTGCSSARAANAPTSNRSGSAFQKVSTYEIDGLKEKECLLFLQNPFLANSEVTIHDVRRCTITEVPEEVRQWIVLTFSRQEQDANERKSKCCLFRLRPDPLSLR